MRTMQAKILTDHKKNASLQPKTQMWEKMGSAMLYRLMKI